MPLAAPICLFWHVMYKQYQTKEFKEETLQKYRMKYRHKNFPD